jgi:hypothetical protein
MEMPSSEEECVVKMQILLNASTLTLALNESTTMWPDFSKEIEHDRLAASKSHPPTSTDAEKSPLQIVIPTTQNSQMTGLEGKAETNSYSIVDKDTVDDDIGDTIENNLKVPRQKEEERIKPPEVKR